MRARARFVIHENSEDGPLVIRDVGPWCNHPTITNDAAAVVAQLLDAELLVPGRRLFYIDSMGQRDELLVVDGAFFDFAPGPRP